MNPVLHLRHRTGLTQSELAGRGGTSQPTIAAYEADRKSPTFRTVERLAEACGLEAHVVYVSPLTREDRRSLHLHAAIGRSIVSDPEGTLARARRNVRTMKKANPGAARLLDEWRRILDGGAERVLDVLADPSAHGRELRHLTPFAGVLSARERHQAYRSFRDAESAAA